MPAGRPEKEIDLKQVEKLASIGLNEGQVAAALGICQDTLTSRKRKYSDFSDALKAGQAKGIATVANNLFEQSKDGNVSAGIFFMKNRAGWSDKLDQNTNHTGDAFNEILLKVVDGSDSGKT